MGRINKNVKGASCCKTSVVLLTESIVSSKPYGIRELKSLNLMVSLEIFCSRTSKINVYLLDYDDNVKFP